MKNCILFTSCAGKWEWLSDSPSLLPPCEGAVSYYTQFGRVSGFTTRAGRRFRAILDQHLELLLWPDGLKVISRPLALTPPCSVPFQPDCA